MTALAELRISAVTAAAGPIPPSWSSLSGLQVLQLAGLSLSGTLPWSNLPQLVSLQLEIMPRLQITNGSISSWASNASMNYLVLANVGGLANTTLTSLGVTYPEPDDADTVWLEPGGQFA